jgi:hypothetical protein
MLAHVFHMRQRKILNDNEWVGWLRWMKSAFEQGTIRQIWENQIEMEKWFDNKDAPKPGLPSIPK